MVVKFKKLRSDAYKPTKAHITDAGFDLTAVGVLAETQSQVTYATGLAVDIPAGYVGLIFPRSSIFKYEMGLSNCVGVVDAGYTGEIKFVFNKTNGFNSARYYPGDRVGQLVVIKLPDVEFEEATELGESHRGDKGFGSSGR